MKLDSVTTEILWRRLITIGEEMATTIVRTSFSNLVGAGADFSCEIVDSQGEGLAHSRSTVGSFVYTMPNAVRALLKKFPKEDYRPGDIFISNDPWLLSGHKGDVCCISPVFRGNRVVAFVCSIAHLADMGGSLEYARVRERYEEGLILPLLYFYRAGEINQVLIDILRENVRFFDLVWGDLHAMVSANNVGMRRVVELMDQYGLDELDSVSEAVLGRAEAAMRAAIRATPDGEYTSEVIFDELDGPLTMKCRVLIEGDELTVDFTGTSPQHGRGGINCTMIYTQSHVAYALHCILMPDVYSNGGCYRPISWVIPEGCILNAQSPASVDNRTATGWHLHGAIHMALAQALPGNVMSSAGLTGACYVYAREGAKASTQWFYVAGGMGATQRNDGISGLLFPTGVKNIPIEQFELSMPVLVKEKGILQDSGGPGRFRGGCAIYATFIPHPAFNGSTLLAGSPNRKYIGASGVLGGLPGKVGAISIDNRPVTREEILQSGTFPVDNRAEGSIIYKESGGGGYGPPWERDVALVQEDVRSGYVSVESAVRDYGVVLNGETLEIDEEATQAAHAAMKEAKATNNIERGAV